jgi:hypothetical protein
MYAFPQVLPWAEKQHGLEELKDVQQDWSKDSEEERDSYKVQMKR